MFVEDLTTLQARLMYTRDVVWLTLEKDNYMAVLPVVRKQEREILYGLIREQIPQNIELKIVRVEDYHGYEIEIESNLRLHMVWKALNINLLWSKEMDVEGYKAIALVWRIHQNRFLWGVVNGKSLELKCIEDFRRKHKRRFWPELQVELFQITLSPDYVYFNYNTLC